MKYITLSTGVLLTFLLSSFTTFPYQRNTSIFNDIKKEYFRFQKLESLDIDILESKNPGLKKISEYQLELWLEDFEPLKYYSDLGYTGRYHSYYSPQFFTIYVSADDYSAILLLHFKSENTAPEIIELSSRICGAPVEKDKMVKWCDQSYSTYNADKNSFTIINREVFTKDFEAEEHIYKITDQKEHVIQ